MQERDDVLLQERNDRVKFFNFIVYIQVMAIHIAQAVVIAKEYVVKSSGYQNVKVATPKKANGKIIVKAISSGKEWTIEINANSGEIVNVYEKGKNGHYRVDTVKKKHR